MVNPNARFKNQHQTAIAKILQQIGTRHDLWKVFRDFVAMAAIAHSNAVDLHQFETREGEYMRIIKPYSKEELKQFAECMARVVTGIDVDSDFLGELFMSLDMGNKRKGQFFTPFSVSHLMAQITLQDGLQEKIEQNGFVTFSDPCIGAGAMGIAAAKVMADSGYNYQTQMHISGIDADIVAVHMAYIQLSLLHIPAIITHGNSLTGETYSHWYTPAHILSLWKFKLRKKEKTDQPVEEIKPKEIQPLIEFLPPLSPNTATQINLF